MTSVTKQRLWASERAEKVSEVTGRAVLLKSCKNKMNGSRGKSGKISSKVSISELHCDFAFPALVCNQLCRDLGFNSILNVRIC